MISRSDGGFSQRERVGREQRSSPMSGRQPQASFKAGIEPEPIEVVAVRVAAARSPTRSPRTSPSGAIPRTSLTRSLMYYAPACWRGAAFPPSTPLSEESRPPSNAAVSFLRETDGRRKLGWLSSVMAGYARSTLCSENPEAAQKEECQQRLCFSWPKEEERGKHSSQAKCSEEINRLFCSGKVAL